MARILIADDALFMRATLTRTLKEAGHEVVGEAETGVAAVNLAGELTPDLVMLDITMPEMDGLAALRKIRETHPQMPVIMCTALGQEAKVREALGAGARDYVLKPFSPAKLLTAITRALG